MMHPLLAKLALLTVCGSLLATADCVGASLGAHDGVRASAAAPASHAWPLTLSPAPDDLALAEVGFPRAARGQRVSRSSLRLATVGPFGDDYLVLAEPLVGAGRTPRALALLVNRPSALLDPVAVHLRLTASAALGRPLIRKSADPFARAGSASKPSLCDLALHGAPLSAAEVRPLLSRGNGLTGFDAASAVAQAYDAVCGLPYVSSFAQAVGQPAAETPSPSPTPSPPTPGPPVCTPCAPAPGYACPLSIGPDICAAAVGGGGRRVSANAH
jgi:hypothetical protein